MQTAVGNRNNNCLVKKGDSFMDMSELIDKSLSISEKNDLILRNDPFFSYEGDEIVFLYSFVVGIKVWEKIINIRDD